MGVGLPDYHNIMTEYYDFSAYTYYSGSLLSFLTSVPQGDLEMFLLKADNILSHTEYVPDEEIYQIGTLNITSNGEINKWTYGGIGGKLNNISSATSFTETYSLLISLYYRSLGLTQLIDTVSDVNANFTNEDRTCNGTLTNYGYGTTTVNPTARTYELKYTYNFSAGDILTIYYSFGSTDSGGAGGTHNLSVEDDNGNVLWNRNTSDQDAPGIAFTLQNLTPQYANIVIPEDTTYITFFSINGNGRRDYPTCNIIRIYNINVIPKANQTKIYQY